VPRWLAPAVLLLAAASVRAACDPPPRPASCAYVAQPPGSCTGDPGCPAGYACTDGVCTAGACERRADCPADGECVLPAAPGAGTCTCRGCGGVVCPIGCRTTLFLAGCVCDAEEDCPPTDDVCFLGFCS
jgi:hypothetical protein